MFEKRKRLRTGRAGGQVFIPRPTGRTHVTEPAIQQTERRKEQNKALKQLDSRRNDCSCAGGCYLYLGLLWFGPSFLSGVRV